MTTYHTDFDARLRRGAGMQRLVNLSGALVSAALIGGAAWWGYELTMRDVSGVPVVQAMDGAFRIAPEDPGGMNAPHQGLSVNEIAAKGIAGGPADAVKLAPPKSALAEDDATQTRLAEQAREEAEAAEAARIAVSEAESDPDLAALTDPSEGAEAVIADAAPEGALATDLAVMEALMGGSGPAADADAGATGSPRPAPRPSEASGLASAETPEIGPESLPAGSKMAQLGAFATPDIARQHWSDIAAAFPDSFSGKRRVVQKADAGGRTFYRLRVEGFDDLAASRRFCSALLAGRADCIPVELR